MSSWIPCRHFVSCEVASKTKHFHSLTSRYFITSQWVCGHFIWVVVILSDHEWWSVLTTVGTSLGWYYIVVHLVLPAVPLVPGLPLSPGVTRSSTTSISCTVVTIYSTSFPLLATTTSGINGTAADSYYSIATAATPRPGIYYVHIWYCW